MILDQPKKVLVETWGCQMNVADSESMLDSLARENFVTTQDENNADVVLLNTCHIREKAKHKVLSRLGVLKELKLRRPGMRIVVAGCVAQAEGARLLREAPQIDVLLGPGKIPELSRLMQENLTTRKQVLGLGFGGGAHRHESTEEKSKLVKAPLSGRTEVSRYINIAQGCNNYCTFCVVPFTRGREISRPASEIVEECRQMVATGVREITLLGQNVNSYGKDLVEGFDQKAFTDEPFVDLLDQVARIPGLQRLRFTTSNPHDLTRAIPNLFMNHAVLGKYMHLPVQSGSNRVLLRMKRKVTREEYFEKLEWLRSVDQEFAISTDLIVGFPGETEEDFEQTLDLVKRSEFSFIYAFMYSPRKNTPAARFIDQIDEKIKSQRLEKLNALQNQITTDLNQREIGRVRSVLVLYESQKHPGVYYGRTEHFRLVRINSERPIVGDSLLVRISDANKTALVGEIV